MPGDRKLSGFAQGLFEVSATKKERLGTIRQTSDGRTFRYAKAGAALTAGQQTYGAAATANHIKVANTGHTAAIGAKTVEILVGATAVTSDQYADGYLQVYDGAAGTVGTQYLINSNTPCGSGGYTILTLDSPLTTAFVATDSMSLIPHPFSSVGQMTDLAVHCTGIAHISVASGYYFWVQTGGQVCSLASETLVLGSVAVGSATTGATGIAAAYTSAFIGVANSYEGVDTKYDPVWMYLH
jgi:hypothetical protein